MTDGESLAPSVPRLAIVVPCYDEAPSVDESARRLSELLERLAQEGCVDHESFIYLVDDGSRDGTWPAIERLHAMDPRIKGLKLSRNFGHQEAQLAGLLAVRERVDCAVTIDADLQQDPEAIRDFLKAHAAGAEIVFGVRRDRHSDGLLKKATALGFYALMKAMGVGTIPNHADYRLVGRKALDALSRYRESNLFLRGIFTDLGFRTETVLFEVSERGAGSTKYTPRRMISLALSGIASFSVVPLRLVALLGLAIWLGSVGMILYVVLVFLSGIGVPGWASTVVPIYFLGGLQLLALGIVGEYLGRLYTEVKGRPRYLEDEELF